MTAYGALAAAYDGLTYDIPYEDMLQFWEAVLDREGKKPESVLDMACGTGSLSVLLAKKGLKVLASDLSEEMLTEAADKAAELDEPPFFICQPMQQLALPFGVDWIVCCLDGVNYLTDPDDCREMLRRCYVNLNEGGILTFDLNSAHKLRGLDGQVWLDENEDSYCVWRTEFDEEENICYYGMDIFTRRGKLWQRDWEEHQQYAYSCEQMEAYLREAGFTKIRFYGDLTMDAPKDDTMRIFVSAVKEEMQ